MNSTITFKGNRIYLHAHMYIFLKVMAIGVRTGGGGSEGEGALAPTLFCKDRQNYDEWTNEKMNHFNF